MNIEKRYFSDIFILRPVIAIVICLALILIGLRGAVELPVSQFPRIESSKLKISTPYVGAPAEMVQGFITDPIERVASTVPGVDFVDSSTTAGMSEVNVWLKLNENSTDALAELSSRLEQIRYELPTGAEDPYVTVIRADRPYATFYLDVALPEGISRGETTDYLTRRVNPILNSIPGVQRVGLEGGRPPAMRIWLQPDRMNAFNISTDDIYHALTTNNVIATIGRSDNNTQRIDLLANTSLQNQNDFERMVIRNVDGAIVRLSDVAEIKQGESEGSVETSLNQKPAIFISIWPQPGANELAIAEHLYKAVDEINETLPHGLHIVVAADVTRYMRSALKEIFITLAETILLVGIVVVAFMGSFRSAIVPLITIPISILGAIAAMSIIGFSLNLLTVLAVVLSVGLVVDDAIIVVENVARFMRQGKSRIEAALASSRQLLIPIIGMTVTLAAVYAPIAMLSGLTGVLFKEFAFTLAVAVLISGVVAITLSPIMSAYVNPEGGKEGKMTQLVNKAFFKVQEFYAAILDKTLQANGQVMTIAVFFSMLILPLFIMSKQELAPIEDESQINMVIEAAPESSLPYTADYMKQGGEILQSLPGATVTWQILTPAGGFGGQDFVQPNERSQTTQDIFPQMFGSVSSLTGLRIFPFLPSALPTAGNFDVEVVIQSSDSSNEMYAYAGKMLQAAMQSGQFLFADTDLKIDLPQGHFIIDRDRVADLGLNLADISNQLSLFLSGNYVNRFDLNGKAYQVIPMIGIDKRPDPDALLQLKLRTPSGDLVPLSAIARLEYKAAPRALAKFDQKNSFRILAAIIPGMTKEQGLQALEQIAAEVLPNSYTIDYAGESRQLRQEGNTLTMVLAFSLISVFLVLAIQFNNFRDPLIVLLGSVPLAFSGALLFTFLDWTTINIYSQIGFITLAGLIAKNAILVVEFANHLQMAGASKLAAIREAAATRLRPVLMTTAATVLGHFPLVLVSGAGAESRNSIGIILVAGMLVGTLFTLFVLPNVYLALSAHHQPKKSAALNATTQAGVSS